MGVIFRAQLVLVFTWFATLEAMRLGYTSPQIQVSNLVSSATVMILVVTNTWSNRADLEERFNEHPWFGGVVAAFGFILPFMALNLDSYQSLADISIILLATPIYLILAVISTIARFKYVNQQEALPKVFLVHRWETNDKLHHVNANGKTLTSDNWKNAVAIAIHEAQILGEDKLIIDHPNAPHKIFKIDKVPELTE